MSLDARVRLPTWRRYAACRPVGRSPFFASDPVSQAIALAVCGDCGVREACLTDALGEERDTMIVYGVRGGLLPSERVALAESSRRLWPSETRVRRS